MQENRKTFENRLKQKVSETELQRVMFVYDLVKSAHRNQFRDDKETRYFEHPRQGCLVLMDELHCYDPKLIIAFLLHDVGEDTALLGDLRKSYEDWKKEAAFRLNIIYPEITPIVIALTKPAIDNKLFTTKEDSYKFYLTGLQTNEQVMLLKMVDKLINSRNSLNATDKKKTQEQIKELTNDYLPIFSKFVSGSGKYKQEFEHVWKALHKTLDLLKKKFQETETAYEVEWTWDNFSPDSFEAPFSSATIRYVSSEKLVEDLTGFYKPNAKHSEVKKVLISLEEYENLEKEGGKKKIKTFN